jgi:hypothetical protein
LEYQVNTNDAKTDGMIFPSDKTRVSANDQTTGYLNGKLVAGTNVTLTENNNGSDETLTISATLGPSPDEKVKVSSNDTTEGYLNGKLVAGTNVTLTENNNGGNETLTVSSTDTNDAAKVSVNDTTPGFLNGKLVAGTGISFTENSDGANETLTITSTVTDTNDKAKVSANDTTAGFLNGKLVAGTNVTLTENNDGANETLTIAAAGGVTGFTASQNTSSPNNTVNASQLLVDATTTNADAVIKPKGTGALLVNLPDSATTGGIKRGARAVDLQSNRDNLNQVASGTDSFIGGGEKNTATGQRSAAFGWVSQATGNAAFSCGFATQSSGDFSFAAGSSNVASGRSAFAVNGATGLGNTASGWYSFTGGSACTAAADYSFVWGQTCDSASPTGSYSLCFGQNSTVAASSSIALGNNANANRYGQFVRSTGMFSTKGDCQWENYVLRRETTNATQTELSCDGSAPGSATRIGIASDSTYTFSALITARRTDADNESAGYKIEGIVDNNAGLTNFVGAPTVTILAEDISAWNVIVEADNTNDALVFKATGEAGKTIRWGATVTLMKVSG